MSLKYNVAVAGFQHETNTFAPHKAHYEDFLKTDSWPGLTVGNDIFTKMKGLNIPLPGFIDAAQNQPFELHPIFWGSAEPCSFVTEDAFERLADQLCKKISDVDNLDAVYLDLHGAMVTEHFEDGEGEVLRRIRELVGDDIPIVISLDLHANVTQAMLDYTDAITIFRTYPHLDMAETGARACELLTEIFAGKTLVSAMRKLPFLVPLSSQGTDFEPCKSIYSEIKHVASSNISHAEFTCGFPPADIKECGPAILVYGENQEAVDAECERLYTLVLNSEGKFEDNLLTPDEAVQQAMQNQSNQPIVIADVQDNPGAGATSDTTGMLQALVTNQAQGALMGVIYDPESAAQAHKSGLGTQASFSIGAKIEYPDVHPYEGEFIIEALGDGNFTCTGDMYKDCKAKLGLMALLKVADDACDVKVIISTERFQCLDLAIIRHLDIEPTQQNIIVVKSTVHFRADFDPIAAETLAAAAAGAHPCQLENINYQNLRKGVRLGPMGVES